MFIGCSSLKELDLSNFDTSSIGTRFDNGYGGTQRMNGLNGLVTNCTSLKKLNISGWDLSNTSGTPYYNSNGEINGVNSSYCDSIGETYSTGLVLIANNLRLPAYFSSLMDDLHPSSVEMNNTDFTNVIYMGRLFSEYSKGADSDLTELTLNGHGSQNIKIMNRTFAGKVGLTSLDLSWLEATPTGTYGLFSGCSSLTNIYVSNKCDFSKSTNSSYMFENCTSLPHFDSSKVDKTNANTSSTGYFTLKQ